MTQSPLMLRSDVRQRITVTGVVQGVGFRPFVHRIASELGLMGFVGNDSGAVFVEIQGDRAVLDEFGRRLRAEAPPLARIGAVAVTDLEPDAAFLREFRIVASRAVTGATTPIPPDVAVCDDCGRKHAPSLSALVDLAKVAERVGRIGRHTLVPPMTALLDLARAAENYSTNSTKNHRRACSTSPVTRAEPTRTSRAPASSNASPNPADSVSLICLP